MYRIVCSDGTVLYDQSQVDTLRVVTEPECSIEIDQNGTNLSFSMLPSHPAYDQILGMKTYLSAERDNEEIYYGRVTEVHTEKTTGVKKVQCTSTMSFFDDFEMPPIPSNEQNMTASDFFTRCINAYNEELQKGSAFVQERALSVGTINHSKANVRREFGLGNYQKVKQALDTYIIKEFGGYFRIRKSGNSRVIDWLEEYGTSNSSPIQLTNNVISHENAITSNEFYTVIHPLGKDSAGLPEVTVNVDDALVNEYGRIVKTISFNNAKDEEELRSEVADFKTKMAKGLGKTCTVKLIDIHFLDNSVGSIQLGAVYENIAGFENEGMTVYSMELHFDNPAEDTVVLKNHRELSAIKNGSATGKISKIISKAFENFHKHITETKEMLSIHADIIELHAKSIRETAQEFERYSRDTDSTIGEIVGTGVLQNSDHITQVAGVFTSKYGYVSDSRLNALRAKGVSPASAGLYKLVFDTVTEDMINSGIEVFGSPNAALNGVPLDTSTLQVGDIIWKAELSTDSEIDPEATYYSKALMVGKGTEVVLDQDGQQVTVYNEIINAQENLLTIEGSALWTQRDNITGVVGEFEVQVDPNTGVRTLIAKSGGGMKIRRDNVEYGLYDNGNLTGGIIVDKVNGQGGSGTLTRIRGEYVDIEASQVRIGSTSNVQTWMNSTGQDISDLQGLVADRATIAQLNAQKARIDTLETDALTADNIEANYLASAALSVYSLETGNITGTTMTLTSSLHADGAFFGDVSSNGNDISNPIVSATVGGTNNDTLTLYKADGTVAATFRKAPTVQLSESWSDNWTTYTVTAVDSHGDPIAGIIPRSITISEDDGKTSADINTELETNANHIAHLNIVAGGESVLTYSIDATGVYNQGQTAGYSSAKLSGTWDGSSWVVSKSDTGTDSVSLTLSARAAISYDSATHKYTALGYARAMQFNRATSDPVESGTEAYADGIASVTISSVAINGTHADTATTISVKATASNGATGTGDINISSQRTNAYNSGWSGSYNSIGISATSSTATYGDTITIYPTGKSSSTASAGNITSKKFTYTVPADRYSDGQTATINGATVSQALQLASDGKSYNYRGVVSGSFSKTGEWTNTGTVVYTNGQNSVTISSVEANGTQAATATTISVKATASNGATGTGDINISSQRTNAYNSGWSGSYNAIGISATSSTATYGDTITIYPTGKSSSTASAGNITSKKFTYTVPADRYQTGYDAGAASVTISSVAINGTHAATATSISVKATASNGATGTGDISISSQRTNAYNAGWAAAAAKFRRDGNTVYGPSASAGGSDRSYTASYTASTYTASAYSASYYRASTHSYNPSSYTASSATQIASNMWQNYTASTYTKETHSYTASTYVAEEYTASKYIASSFSWSA